MKKNLSIINSFKDIYVFPLRSDKYSYWIWDQADNFVFQFEFDNEEKRDLLLLVINEEKELQNKELSFYHKNGYIYDNLDRRVILIRGWGNLTGTGAHNLAPKVAALVQDTFADFIIERLNKRN